MWSTTRVRAEDGGQPAGEGGLPRPGRPVDADQPGGAQPRRGGVDALAPAGEAVQRRRGSTWAPGRRWSMTSPRLASRRRWASVSVTAKIRIRRSYWSQGRDQVRWAASCHGVRARVRPDRVEQLGQPLLVVGREGVDAVVEAAEAPFVGGQHLGRVQVAHGGQGVEEVAQRIGVPPGVVEMLGLIRGGRGRRRRTARCSPRRSTGGPACGPGCGRRASASRGSRRARRPRAAGRARPCG